MNVLDRPGSALPGSVGNLEARPSELSLNSSALMGKDDGEPISLPSGSDPHVDARAIVRLVQCRQCSLPLRAPMTLPCGNSICPPCLPERHKRENITYPAIQARQERFACPFKECGQEHSVADCAQDVTLTKILERVALDVAQCRPLASDTPTRLVEEPHWTNIAAVSAMDFQPRSRVLHGGRLVATYTMAELGELSYDSDVAYQSMSPAGDEYRELDTAMLEHLKEVTRGEMDCQVCYNTMLDPLTTPCGHTFCRKCVARVLDHSDICPVCRRTLHIPPGVKNEPSNKCLSKLLMEFCAEHVAARAEAVAEEEEALRKMVPLFVCTLAYPTMPTFLHIFEPRYRRMMRRVWDSDDRTFGMIMYNRRRGGQHAQAGDGHYMEVGTLLQIVNMQVLTDGRSLLETIGVSRFRTRETEVLDGYMVGAIERFDDVTLEEEENTEATEVAREVPADDPLAQLECMPTEELLRIGTDFVARMRAASAPWLSANIIESYGQPPNDPVIFPYWLACILPISEEEKYRLLPATSVRERLKMTARWVRRIEAQRWYVGLFGR